MRRVALSLVVLMALLGGCSNEGQEAKDRAAAKAASVKKDRLERERAAVVQRARASVKKDRLERERAAVVQRARARRAKARRTVKRRRARAARLKREREQQAAATQQQQQAPSQQSQQQAPQQQGPTTPGCPQYTAPNGQGGCGPTGNEYYRDKPKGDAYGDQIPEVPGIQGE